MDLVPTFVLSMNKFTKQLSLYLTSFMDLCYPLKAIAATFVVAHKPEAKEAAYKIEEKNKTPFINNNMVILSNCRLAVKTKA